MRRKTQAKTKKFGKSLFAILAIVAVIVAINVGTFNNRTNEATTNLAKDGETVMPFTEEQVLTAAVDVAMNGYTYGTNNHGFPTSINYYHLDCSTFVSTTIMKLGGVFNSSYQFTANSWASSAVPFTYNGQTITAQKITEAHDVPAGTAWTAAIDASLLKPGDIIAGDGHMFLYVGKAATQEEIVSQLATKTGLSIETINSTNISSSTGKLNYDGVNGQRTDQYWIIEGNIGTNKSPLGTGPIASGTETNVNKPYLSNYNWAYRTDTKSLDDVVVYRITSVQSHKGSVGLYKYIDQNKNGQWDQGEPALQNAKFKLATDSAGTQFVKKNGADYEVTTGADGTAIFTDIDLGSATTGTFYLVETYVPDGYTIKNRVTQVTAKETGYNVEDISTLVQVGNGQVQNVGKVGVYKYEDVNGNGHWDQGEPALAGAKFKLAKNRNGTDFVQKNGSDYEVTTGQDGKALFTDIDIGTETEKTFYLVETYAPEGFNLLTTPIAVDVKYDDSIDYTDISNLVNIGNKKKIYDLALRKYITAVKDGATGEEKAVNDRVPKITIPENFNTPECTTLKYDHPKDPVVVHTTDIVTYNIEVFNEGPEDAYSEITKDDLPKGLEFLPDSEVNKEYRWKLVDANDNEVDDISKAKYIITDYLSKAQGADNLIKAFDPNTMDKPDSKIVKVQFKVTEPTTSDRILINSAQIARETDSNGNVVTDRDSTPNEWKGEDDEDIEKVRVLYFDLALRKWVVQAIVTKDGNETIYETGHKAEDNPEDIVKVDLKKSDLSKVTVKFKYKIRITNEGQIAGEAKVVRDDVPNGLKFVQEDNPNWKVEDGKIVTEQLADTTLQPGESTEMDIILTWINGEDNLNVMTNISEIEKDHNVYGTHDIDSTPGNKKTGEDDIDDAPVMLAIKTGSEIIKYVALAAGIMAFIGVSVIIIKKKVLNY